MIRTVYKVLAISQEGLQSCLKHNPHWCAYAPNVRTFPSIGKLFAFETVAEAIRFCNCFFLDKCVYKASADIYTGPRPKCFPSSVKGYTVQDTWEGNMVDASEAERFGVLCNWIELIKEVA